MKLPKLRPIYRVLIYLGTVLFAATSILDTIFNYLPDYLAVALYVCAACSLSISCCYGVQDIHHLSKTVIRPGIAANSFTNKVSTDYRYRTILFALPGFGLNVIFAVFNGIIAVISRSGWYLFLATYYLLLSVMRSAAIGYIKSPGQSAQAANQALRELKVYRRCGFLLIMMSISLGGAVMMMVRTGSGKNYPGILIYAVAAYTFWKISISIVNLVKARRTRSPLLMTLRNIGYADAMVSMLSLQTAMFAEFAEGENQFTQLMNAMTGLVVCLIIMGMGIYIVQNSCKINVVPADNKKAQLGGMK